MQPDLPEHWSKNQIKAYKEGRKAKINGKHKQDNPYNPTFNSFPCYLAWLNGYDSMNQSVKLSHQYSIIVGDYSNDGHGRSETFIFKCNHEEKDITEAYEKTVKASKISLDNEKSILSDYEDNMISSKQMKQLVKAGVNKEALTNIYHNTLESTIEPKGVAVLFLEMAKANLPDLVYEFSKPKCIMEGIGYGCF